MNKEFDVPDVLYRGFGALEHARAFVDKGFIRFGWLEGYRTIEDPRRRDQNEGKALLHTPIIPEHWEGRHKVYVLCCSVDPAYVASKFPYVVRINNPKTMIVEFMFHLIPWSRIPKSKRDGLVMIAVARCKNRRTLTSGLILHTRRSRIASRPKENIESRFLAGSHVRVHPQIRSGHGLWSPSS